MLPVRRLLLIITALGTGFPAWAGNPAGSDYHVEWERSGDLLQFVLPLAGIGLTFLLDPLASAPPSNDNSAQATQAAESPMRWPGPQIDGRFRHDFLVGLLRMEMTTYAVKYAIDEIRPNGSGQSFPSGHTASAFFGAEYMRREYGPWVGIPAYAAAGWVGYTRVYSQHHYWHDVFAGALLGVMSNWNNGQIPTRWGPLQIAPGLINSPGPLLGSSAASTPYPAFRGGHQTLGLTLHFDF